MKLYKWCMPLCAIGSLGCAPMLSAEDTLQDLAERQIRNKDDAFFTLSVENDLFGSGRDENYTSGVMLNYYDVGSEPSDLVMKLGRSIPFFDVNKTTSVYYSVGQNLYTPRDISTTNPNPDDRPYAGFLYGSIGYTTIVDNHVDDAEVTIGVVGPSALGEQTQKTVHDQINSVDPRGWDHQLKDEPALMVSMQRKWPVAWDAEWKPFYTRFEPHGGLTLGNIYTYAAVGGTIHLVPSRHKWQASPSRVRPSIPASGYFSGTDDQFSWSAFAGFEGRAVARNIFLDGNTFKDSRSVDKKYGVLDLSAGVTTTYDRLRIGYTVNWRSKEFREQKDNSFYGAMSVGYRF